MWVFKQVPSIHLCYNWLPKMLLQYNSGVTDLYIQIFEIFISYAVWIFMAKTKGIFSNSEDHNKKCFLLSIFVFYLLNSYICKPIFDGDDFHCWWNRRKVMSQWISVHTSVWILDKLCTISTIISYVYTVS